MLSSLNIFTAQFTSSLSATTVHIVKKLLTKVGLWVIESQKDTDCTNHMEYQSLSEPSHSLIPRTHAPTPTSTYLPYTPKLNAAQAWELFFCQGTQASIQAYEARHRDSPITHKTYTQPFPAIAQYMRALIFLYASDALRGYRQITFREAFISRDAYHFMADSICSHRVTYDIP